jgi:guanylate kinase
MLLLPFFFCDTMSASITATTPGIIALVGCSGVGKDTLRDALVRARPTRYEKPIGSTTRAARVHETDGAHYNFLSSAAFDALAADGAFIEHVHIHGNSYGITRAEVDAIHARGKQCVMILNRHGAKELRDLGFRVHLVRIDTASVECRARLEARKDTPTDIETRMQTRVVEEADYAAHADEFAVSFTNPDGHVDTTVQKLLAWLDDVE